MARFVFKKKKKLARKYGTISGIPHVVGRPGRIGQHSAKRGSKPTEYRIGLDQKNKLRACYGISEKQFINAFRRAFKAEDTSEALLQDLETRLDVLVFRLGLAPTMPAARQFVVHGHIEVQTRANLRYVNSDAGKGAELEYDKVDRPAYRVQAGQKVRLTEKSKSKNIPVIEESIAKAEHVDYVNFDKDKLTGCFTRIPTADEIPVEVEVAKIIEFSSRKV